MLLRRLVLLSCLVCLFAVVATATVWVVHRPPGAGDPTAAAPGTAAPESAGPAAAVQETGHRRGVPPRASRRARARAILADWDDARAAAWSAADVTALRALYVPGSRTGRRDARMLTRWRARDLRVEGMRTQVREFRVLARSPGRWRLRVTDRVVGSVAVGRSSELALPDDGWNERTIELRRETDGWRVAEVRGSARS